MGLSANSKLDFDISRKMSAKIVLKGLKAIFGLIGLLLYISDIYSDIAFTILLYNNCHYNYFKGALATFVISYLTTVIHQKFIVKYPTTWRKAIFYPFFTVFVIYEKCASMITNKLSEEETLMHEIYLSNVKTIETMSEATIQLALNGMVMKEFGLEFEELCGIKYSIQAISAALSMISIYKCLVDRFSFIRNDGDKGPVSKEFLKAMGDLAIPILTIFSVMLFTWSDTTMTPELSFVIMMFLHPMMAFIFMLLDILLKQINRCKITKLLESIIMFSPIAYMTSLICIRLYATLLVSVTKKEILLNMPLKNEIFQFPGEVNEDFNPRNFNSSLTFNLCLQETRRNNSNIDLGDYLSSEQVYWTYWLWILLVLTLIHTILSQFSKILNFSYLTKYCGRPIGMIEFYRGPKLPEQEDYNQVQDNQENIELEPMNHPNAIDSNG